MGPVALVAPPAGTDFPLAAGVIEGAEAGPWGRCTSFGHRGAAEADLVAFEGRRAVQEAAAQSTEGVGAGRPYACLLCTYESKASCRTVPSLVKPLTLSPLLTPTCVAGPPRW